MEDFIQLINQSRMNKIHPIKIITLIELSLPLLSIIITKDSLYLVHVLRDQTLIKNNKKLNIKEIFVSESSATNVLNMVNNTNTVYKTLQLGKQSYRYGKIGTKYFKPKIVKDLSNISNQLPNKNYFLNLNSYDQKLYKKLILKHFNWYYKKRKITQEA